MRQRSNAFLAFQAPHYHRPEATVQTRPLFGSRRAFTRNRSRTAEVRSLHTAIALTLVQLLLTLAPRAHAQVGDVLKQKTREKVEKHVGNPTMGKQQRRIVRDPSCRFVPASAIRPLDVPPHPKANGIDFISEIFDEVDPNRFLITAPVLDRLLLNLSIGLEEGCVQIEDPSPRRGSAEKYIILDEARSEEHERIAGLRPANALRNGLDRVFGWTMLVGKPGACMAWRYTPDGKRLPGYVFEPEERKALEARRHEIVRLSALYVQRGRSEGGTPVNPTSVCQVEESDKRIVTPATSTPEEPHDAKVDDVVTRAIASSSGQVVRMVGDARGYRFEPASFTVKQGGTVTFVLVSGAPHGIAFDADRIPSAAAARLRAQIPWAIVGMSQLVIQPGEKIVMSFAGVPAGTYAYNCVPHMAMGMTGVITVTR
jgi:plastocyanin